MYEVQPARKGPSGMLGFSIVWFGQVISLLGSSMTGFALTFWAWQVSGTATALALVGFFSFAPSIIVSPLAGALVDRWDRKLVMMLSDLAAGLSSIIVFILYQNDMLQIWHLYVTGAFASVFQAFQWPAYSAAISTMLPKKHYARASGMISMADSGANIVAPALAGFLLVTIGIGGVLIIDMITFVVAVSSIAFIFIPKPKVSEAGEASKGSLLKESGFGFRYILSRPSLLGLQLMFFITNFMGGFQFTLTAPMVLARTDGNVTAFGTIQAAMGIGGLLGGLILSIWGGPKRKVHGVLIGMMLCNFFSGVLMGLGQTAWVWALAAFMTMFFMPVLNGSNQAIWQSKVPPDIQGRVFAVRRLIAQVSSPVAVLMVGPLADKLFEPRMDVGGAWASTFGPLVGTGDGAGMAMLMVISGTIGILGGLSGYLFPAIRNAETLIPDHTDDHEEPAPSPAIQLGELQPAD
ncbi:MAG TPA: MFS transporter [Herpetosiphonaceae bacterium]|nr:MFS transporter [Herpetosiphonaceae bacterium]